MVIFATRFSARRATASAPGGRWPLPVRGPGSACRWRCPLGGSRGLPQRTTPGTPPPPAERRPL